ncbi:MAG: hypothetical protein QOJ57_183 [Thermoleophilaceae bacterium]|nr:hypothetical protein [Thermoleophilaceae bacterium]
MHPFLQAQLAALHENDLRAEVEAARGPRRAASAAVARPADVVIRRATSADGPALAALSALDAAAMPFGPALVAEVAGVPRAVLPLDGGRSFGDPFARTDELVALLELRARQIRREQHPERSGLRRALSWASPATLRRPV